MRILDFLFGSSREKKAKGEKKASKEEAKRRKEKEKTKEKVKRREQEPEKGSSDPKATSSTTSKTTSLDLRLPQASEVLEETSAMAQSSEPEEPKSWEYEDAVGDQTFGQKIKDMADKSVRRVRKISSSTRSKRDFGGSRPIKEKTLDRFMERVKQRQERRIKSAERMVHDSECVFPDSADVVRAESIVAKKDVGSAEKSSRRKEKGKGEEKKEEGKSSSREKVDESSRRSPRKKKKEKKEKEKERDVDGSNRSTRSEKSEKSSRRTKQSPLKQIQKIFPDLSKKGRQERKEKNELKKKEKEETQRRKSREKNLFVNGRPFWVVGGKMSAEEKAEMTQDDLPLNAAIILEVRKGNIDLPVLPNVKIKFDPWAPLEELKARDENLFNHKMLFANTIRSMINSADFTGTDGTSGEGATGVTPPPENGRRCEFTPHPTYYWNYDRAHPENMRKEEFRWEGLGVA